MKTTLAVLADAANISREGKVNILGIFQVIYGKAFPLTHPQMSLVLRLEAGITEVGRKKHIEVILVDEDGKKLFKLDGQLVVGEVKPGEVYASNQIFTLQNLKFEKPGSYKFDIFIDNQPIQEIPLKVLKIE